MKDTEFVPKAQLLNFVRRILWKQVTRSEAWFLLVLDKEPFYDAS